jgi:hypothetical protein
MNRLLGTLHLMMAFLVAGAPGSASAAPSTLGEVGVVPRVVKVGASTVVTATIPIADPGYIPGSAAVFRADSSGKLLGRLALFVDDGSNGDRVAGDRIYTARWTVTSAELGVIPVVATAAFRGVVVRVTSRPQFIEVAADADATTPKASLQGNALQFIDAAGTIAREIPIIPVEDRTTAGVIDRTVRDVLISADQGRAGVFEFLDSAPAGSSEVLEFSTIGARFKFYSARDGEMSSVDAPSGKSFFVPSSRRLLSRKGDRVVLVAAGEAETDPQFFVYTDAGRLVYQSPESFALIRDVALSPDGRYIAYIVVRGGVVATETVFRVVEVDTRREWEKVYDANTADSQFFVPAANGFALFLNGAISASFP